MTRDEKSDGRRIGETPRYRPAGRFVLFLLLSGCRLGEAVALEWSHCYLDGEAPELILPASLTKTQADRSVDLNVSPSLVALLKSMWIGHKGKYVFGGRAPLSRPWIAAMRKRLIRKFGAPEWGPQALRATCASVLCSAPSIYDSASIFLESKRLGHSVAIAESRYAATFRDLPREAKTIEAAIGIEELARRIAGAVVSNRAARAARGNP